MLTDIYFLQFGDTFLPDQTMVTKLGKQWCGAFRTVNNKHDEILMSTSIHFDRFFYVRALWTRLCSLVVESLFIVPSIVSGSFVFGACLIIYHYLVSLLVFNHLGWKRELVALL